MTRYIMPGGTLRYIAVIVAALLAVAALHTAAVAEGAMFYVVVDEDSWLNVREHPVNGDVYMRLERGTAVEVLETTGDWAYIAEGSERGYVAMEYLSVLPAEEPMAARIRSNGRVALRRKPDGKREKWLEDGYEVTIYGWLDGKDARWARVDGGFVNGEYLEVIDGDT